jgi:hypothetical protein
MCSSFSPDGLFLAFGTFQGKITIKDNNMTDIIEFE